MPKLAYWVRSFFEIYSFCNESSWLFLKVKKTATPTQKKARMARARKNHKKPIPGASNTPPNKDGAIPRIADRDPSIIPQVAS